MEGHLLQVLYFLDGASLSVKLDFQDPLTRPPAQPNPSQLCIEISCVNKACVHNIRVKLRNLK